MTKRPPSCEPEIELSVSLLGGKVDELHYLAAGFVIVAFEKEPQPLLEAIWAKHVAERLGDQPRGRTALPGRNRELP